MDNLLNILNLRGYFNSENNNIILEPLSCIIRLIILKHKVKGTKISIYNNSIKYDYPDQYQGVIRNVKGNSREQLHNIYNPLEKSFEWYSKDDKRYNLFYKECILGLNVLSNTYNKDTIVYHTLQHYITNIQNNQDGKKKEKSKHSPLLDKLKDFWKEDEINIIYTTLKFLDTCVDDEKEIYLEIIDTILRFKEQKIKDYIIKSSTSYN